MLGMGWGERVIINLNRAEDIEIMTLQKTSGETRHLSC